MLETPMTWTAGSEPSGAGVAVGSGEEVDSEAELDESVAVVLDESVLDESVPVLDESVAVLDSVLTEPEAWLKASSASPGVISSEDCTGFLVLRTSAPRASASVSMKAIVGPARIDAGSWTTTSAAKG